MQARIHTKSNYRNLNGQILTVVEIMASPYSEKKRITCQIYAHEFSTCIRVDFYGGEASIVKGRKVRKKKGGAHE